MASSPRTWTVTTAAPPREVFAVMEQAIGTPPYRFEVIDARTARIVEIWRKGFFGNWLAVKRRALVVTCTAESTGSVTTVRLEASPARAPISRALQLVTLFKLGDSDRKTVYRDRHIPPGPVSLVASWAGTPYALYLEPSYTAERGATIHTATRMTAVSDLTGGFIRVRTADGAEGYVERDQIVPAPEEAVRRAGVETARFG